MNVYRSGAAFRRALEERLRSRSLDAGVPLVRLRKTVAFDCILARLIQLQPDRWILKGGFAIQLRLEDKARTTKDIDLLALADSSEVLVLLRIVGEFDLEDWFRFEVEQSEDQAFDKLGGSRIHIRSLLDGRTFEDFHIDVGIGDPVIDPVDPLRGPHSWISLASSLQLSPVIQSPSKSLKKFVPTLDLTPRARVHASRIS